MRLYFKYVSILIRSQLIHKRSFILLCIGQFFVPFYVFYGMVLLFEQFGNLDGWKLYEVALLYGITHICFSVSESIVRGFDSFSNLIVQGEFDRIMVRPQSTVLQVLGSKFELTRIGRLIQGLAVFIWAVSHVEVQWTLLKALTIVFMIIGGTFIMSGIFILFASVCFFTVKGLEIVNIFTDGGRELSQYPIDIYKKGIRWFFTFIIPFGTVNYLPLKFILGHHGYDSIGYVFLPLSGILFMIPSLLIWEYGVSKYKSTGS